MTSNTGAPSRGGLPLLAAALCVAAFAGEARALPFLDASQDFLPSATERSARSAALFVRQIRPSSRKRANASQRFSM